MNASRYEKCVDEESGYEYFYDAETGEWSWEDPTATVLIPAEEETLETKLERFERQEEEKKLAKKQERQAEREKLEQLRREKVAAIESIQARIRIRDRLGRKHKHIVTKVKRTWVREELEYHRQLKRERVASLKQQNRQERDDLYSGMKVLRLESLREASLNGDVERIQQLVQEGHDVNRTSAVGLTPLIAASRTGSYDAVKMLLKHGACVNQRHFVSKRTALMEACTRANVGVIRELLRFGAHIHLRDRENRSAREGIRDRTVRFIHDLACEPWKCENAFLFPNEFRAVALTMALISQRQKKLYCTRIERQKQSAKNDLASVQTELTQSQAKFENQSKAARIESTILRQCKALFQCDDQYDADRLVALEKCFAIHYKLLAAESISYMDPKIIETILSYCPRHWFDRFSVDAKRIRYKIRRFPPSGTGQYVIQATKLHDPPGKLSESVVQALEEKQNRVEKLLNQYANLLQDQYICPKTNVSRSVDDHKSLARLDICVSEGSHLPRRTVPTRDMIDPVVKVIVRSRSDPTYEVSVESEPRYSDMHPVWDQWLRIDGIPSTDCRLIIRVQDFNRETAGEVTLDVRSLLDQKEHDDWYILPPTLKQQVYEKDSRPHDARLRVILRFTHAKSLLMTKQIQQAMKDRNQVVHDQFRPEITAKLRYYTDEIKDKIV